MISIVIPSRNERYLKKTVDDIYRNALGDFEVIVVLDGETDFPVPDHLPDLTILENPTPIGITPSIEKAIAASSGDYILKTDAHCAFGEGFDVKLRKDCEEDWVVVARRYTLDIESWSPVPRIVDYYYLSCPWTSNRGLMMGSLPWMVKTWENEDKTIDDLMAFQGSMWFMPRKHWNRLGIFEAIGDSYAEHHEISMRTWLGGGRVIVNKNTWYAHIKYIHGGRTFDLGTNKIFRDHIKSAQYWTGNMWKDRVHDFDWLIDKFWPLPLEHTRHRLEKYYWPEDWRKYYDGVV